MSSQNRIAYLGPRGTFTERAVEQVSGFAEAELLPLGSVAEVFDAVLSGRARRAVVPIENSIEGGVSATSDALANMDGLQIYAEYLVKVQFDLMAVAATQVSQVRQVFTHPVAYAQTRNWLSENLPSHTHIPTGSTAAAAAGLADASTDTSGAVAVAAPHVAAIYGLTTLAADIGDNKHAQTRFIEVGLRGKPAPATGSDKTSVIVELPDDRPGGLLEMLEQFAARGVNLSRIESRPVGDRFGRYRFNIDAAGHIEDHAIAEALMGLHRFSPRVIFLGSYAKADGSESVHTGNNANQAYQDAQAWLNQLRG
jgi:prephenate dehydratase